MKTLKHLFLDELNAQYDAEKQLVHAIPKIANVVTSSELKKTLLSHLEQTKNHVTKLETIYNALSEKIGENKCASTVALIKEGADTAITFRGSPASNAAVIASMLKVEHHEIASYGCLHGWAKLLDNSEVVEILETILKEEKEACEALIEVACLYSNKEALAQVTCESSSCNSTSPSKSSASAARNM